MTSSALGNLTKRLTHLSIRAADKECSLLLHETLSRPMMMVRLFQGGPVSSTKVNTNPMIRSFSSSSLLRKDIPGTSVSDKQWNMWQQSLLTNVTPDNEASSSNLSANKKRGGKTLRKRKEAAVSVSASSQERLIDAGPGQFPPLRYSDEETERLLQEAYAKIPARTGKRGTKSFKRQKVRFMGIRKARSIKKMEKVRHHYDKMEKRSAKVKAIRRMKEMAVESREQDRLYQESVLRKWAAIHGVALKKVDV